MPHALSVNRREGSQARFFTRKSNWEEKSTVECYTPFKLNANFLVYYVGKILIKLVRGLTESV